MPACATSKECPRSPRPADMAATCRTLSTTLADTATKATNGCCCGGAVVHRTHLTPPPSPGYLRPVPGFQDWGRHGDGNSHVGQALRDGWRCLVFMKDVEDIDGRVPLCRFSVAEAGCGVSPRGRCELSLSVQTRATFDSCSVVLAGSEADEAVLLLRITRCGRSVNTCRRKSQRLARTCRLSFAVFQVPRAR